MLELIIEEFKRVIERIGSAFGNVEFVIQFQQFEVRSRRGAGEGKHHATFSLLGGEETRACSFVLATNSSPKIDFPSGIHGGQIRIPGLPIVRSGSCEKSILAARGFGVV